MPLIELKQYMPKCDQCGRIGGVWQALAEDAREQAIPEGWRLHKVQMFVSGSVEVSAYRELLLCESCGESAEPPENDSRA